MATITTDNKSTAKHQSILSAATAVFLEFGYGATSMDAIARRAEVSKQTIYNHFTSKDVLFGAIIANQCGKNIPQLTQEACEQPPALVLANIARTSLGMMMSEDSLALFRLVMAEMSRFPELAQAFYHAGPSVALQSLAAYLEQVKQQGVLQLDDPLLAAEHFLSLVRGEFHLRALMGIESNPDPERVEDFIQASVRFFLAAYTHFPTQYQ